MAKGQLQTFVDYLSRITAPPTPPGETDGQLLQQYTTKRDQSAFESLVKRHGPYVRGVCLRILGDPHEADDAFQATFLVLISKAHSIGRRDSIGGWLYRVACRTAWRAKSDRRRRRSLEGQVHEMTVSDPIPDLVWRDMKPVLDEELNRLPAKYQTPIILCCLQGKTKEEAARELGLSEGTLSSRLARARERLRQRLARRGLAYSTTAIGAVLVPSNVTAAITPALTTATINAASAFTFAVPAAGLVSTKITILAEGVVRSMFLTKLKIAAAVVGSIMLVTGGGVGYRLVAKSTAEQQAAKAESRPDEKENSAEQKKVPGRTLTGRVVDDKGKPIPLATVHIRTLKYRPVLGTTGGAAQKIQEWHVNVDANGVYTVRGLKEDINYIDIIALAKGLVDRGRYNIDGQKPTHKRVVSNLAKRFASGKLDDIVMTQGVVISGRCLGGDGKPVANASIQSHSSGSTPAPEKEIGGLEKRAVSMGAQIFVDGQPCTTDANGRFEFSAPKGLKTEFDVYSPNWVPQHFTVDEDHPNLGDIRLSGGTRVKGGLLGHDGKPLSGCFVRFEHNEMGKYPSIVLVRKTKRDGTFDLPPLKGNYKVSLVSIYYTDLDGTTLISDHPKARIVPQVYEFDGSGEKALTLEVAPTFRICGKLVGPDGKRAKFGYITLFTQLGDPPSSFTELLATELDAEGRYVLDGIPKGLSNCQMRIIASVGPEKGLVLPHPLPGVKAKYANGGQFVILEELDKDLDNVDFELRPMGR